MKFNFHTPKKELTDFVKCIWSLECARGSKTEDERIVPSGCIELYFYYNSWPQFIDKSESITSKYNTFVSGQKLTYERIRTEGAIGIFSVMLNPESSYPLLGIPANELSSRQIALNDLWGVSGEEISEQVLTAKSGEERSNLVQDFLIEKLLHNSELINPRINKTVKLINSNGGLVEIKSLSDSACLSRRQFERSFIENVGLAPKQFARVVRLQKILSLKQNNKKIDLTQLATIAGYFDQAHFINDFKTMTGFTPGSYFKLYPAFSDYYSFM